jgi:hypothetical protein
MHFMKMVHDGEELQRWRPFNGLNLYHNKGTSSKIKYIGLSSMAYLVVMWGSLIYAPNDSNKRCILWEQLIVLLPINKLYICDYNMVEQRCDKTNQCGKLMP